MTTELWTEKEVSEKFRIPTSTLRYWRMKKTVLPCRIVRYDPREVEATVDAAKVDLASTGKVTR